MSRAPAEPEDRNDHEESNALAPRLNYDSATGQLSYSFPSPPPSPSFSLIKVEVQVAPASVSITREKCRYDGAERKKWAHAPYNLNYQVDSTSWPFFADKGFGVYRVRAKAQFRDPSRKKATARLFWGPHSDVLYVNYDGEAFEPTPFQWQNVQHRHHLSACLPMLPDVLIPMIGNYVTEPIQWDVQRSVANMVVGRDAQGYATVARYVGQAGTRRNIWYRKTSILSARALVNPALGASSKESRCVSESKSQSVSDTSSFASSSSAFASSSSASASSPPSASSSSVRFDVRVDYVSRPGLAIGVCHKELNVNQSRYRGLVYACSGYVYHRGHSVRVLPSYAGDVISVKVDFAAQTVSFFKNDILSANGVIKVSNCDPGDGGLDLSRPLYACMTSSHPNDQVTLLS